MGYFFFKYPLFFNTLLKPNVTLLLRMHTNVADFNVLRRLMPSCMKLTCEINIAWTTFLGLTTDHDLWRPTLTVYNTEFLLTHCTGTVIVSSVYFFFKLIAFSLLFTLVSFFTFIIMHFCMVCPFAHSLLCTFAWRVLFHVHYALLHGVSFFTFIMHFCMVCPFSRSLLCTFAWRVLFHVYYALLHGVSFFTFIMHFCMACPFSRSLLCTFAWCVLFHVHYYALLHGVSFFTFIMHFCMVCPFSRLLCTFAWRVLFHVHYYALLHGVSFFTFIMHFCMVCPFSRLLCTFACRVLFHVHYYTLLHGVSFFTFIIMQFCMACPFSRSLLYTFAWCVLFHVHYYAVLQSFSVHYVRFCIRVHLLSFLPFASSWSLCLWWPSSSPSLWESPSVVHLHRTWWSLQEIQKYEVGI